SFWLQILKQIALGLGKEAITECNLLVKRMIGQVAGGVVLDIPAGTGLFTFDEYVKHPGITFIAAEYSRGMLEKAREKAAELKAKNIILVRADVGRLPFKDDCFDAVLCLNGIHSFPEKNRSIRQMSRVLKKNKKIFGTLILGGERRLTDLVLKAAYFRLKWFMPPALTCGELVALLESHGLRICDKKILKAALAFEAEKITAPDASLQFPPA
ncbi:MAG: methyltransferase domain-containing protein, partial [Candidatus Margulisbacteria bacterium]|nr:methyltransferase domain-containing protein [Candidatus Margulisiibacteriota bacterium]